MLRQTQTIGEKRFKDVEYHNFKKQHALAYINKLYMKKL